MAALLTSLDPTLLLAPGRSHDRNGPVSPTLSGGVLTVPGQYGQAWQVAEATTNLAYNPSAAGNTRWGSWSAGGSSEFVTTEPLPDGAPVTARIFRYYRPDVGSVTITFSGGALRGFAGAPGETYTASAYVKHKAGVDKVLQLAIGFYDATGAFIGSSLVPTVSLTAPTNTWARIVSTFTVPSGASYFLPVLGVIGGALEILATMGQVEKKAYATPYADGSLGPGHTWSGVANASSSTRAAAGVAFPVEFGTDRGAIVFRYDPFVTSTKPQNPHLVYGSGFNFFRNTTLTRYSLSLGGNTLSSGIVTENTGFQTLYIDWENGWKRIFRDNVLIGEGAYTAPAIIPATLSLGAANPYTFDGDTEGLLLFDRPLTPDEREALFSVPEPWDWSMFEPLVVTSPPAVIRSTPRIAGFRTGAIHQHPASLLTIDGIPTKADSWTTRHGVDQPVGTASLSVPVGSDTSHIEINAPIELHAGYRDEATERVFLGHIVDVVQRAGIDGKTFRIQCEDETARFRYRTEDELIYRGRTTFTDLARSLAARRAVQLFSAEKVLFPNGASEIALGGVPEIDGGDVVLRRRISPLTYLTAKANLFGYRLFGAPRGTTELQRVSGTPSGEPVATFTEGVDIFEVEGSRSRRDIINYWTVYGARYSDKDGVPIELIAQAAEVPYDALLDPPGYAPGDESDPDLVTQALVDAVRQVREIDYSQPSEIATWTTWGRPEIQPGDVIAIQAAGGGIDAQSLRWVLSVQHSRSSRGFTTTLTAWAGGGTPLPAGITEEIIPIGSVGQVYRLGDEYLPHYVYGSSDGQERVTVPFTVPKEYTSLALRGRQHGTNSYLLDGTNTEASVSKLEVWQNGERVGSAQLPMSPENLSAAYDYTDDQYWTPFRMPIPGQLEAGSAELRIIAGRDSRISDVFALDDFEVKDLELEARGTGRPLLPGVA